MWLSLVWSFGLVMAASLGVSGIGLWDGAGVYQKVSYILLPVIVATLPTGIFTWWLIRERRKN